MSSGDATGHRLTPRALDDLDDIWRFSAETWSIKQADRYIDELARVFETIAIMPALARERNEFTPLARIHIHLHESQLIVYTIEADHISILRLLGGQKGWISILKAADL